MLFHQGTLLSASAHAGSAVIGVFGLERVAIHVHHCECITKQAAMRLPMQTASHLHNVAYVVAMLSQTTISKPACKHKHPDSAGCHACTCWHSTAKHNVHDLQLL